MKIPRGNHFKCLPVSPIDHDWGLFIKSAGMFSIPAGSKYPLSIPKTHYFSYEHGRILSEYAIVYITRGKGSFETRETSRKTVKKGDLFLLFPGQWHRYKPDPAVGWNEYWICFDGEYIHDLCNKGFISPKHSLFHLEQGESKIVADLFRQILETIKRGRLGYAQIAASDVPAIIAQALASKRRSGIPDTNAEPLIRKAKDMVVELADRSLDVPNLARQLGVGYSWLRQTFKRHTGLAPGQYHMQVRLHKAQQLLETTDMTVQQISASLAYDTQNYFSRIFKKHTGHWPTDWRKTHQCRPTI